MIDMDMQLYHTDLRIIEAERAVESQKLRIGSLAWDGHETGDAERTLRDLRAQLDAQRFAARCRTGFCRLLRPPRKSGCNEKYRRSKIRGVL
jgi:hypothetical protein